MPDDDIQQIIENLRTSVSKAETTIVNEIRALGGRFDLLLERIESRLTSIEAGR